jgi:hypothetical protein
MNPQDEINYVANVLKFSHEFLPSDIKGEHSLQDAVIAIDCLRHLGWVEEKTFLSLTQLLAEQQKTVERLETNIRAITESHEAERNIWQTKGNPA